MDASTLAARIRELREAAGMTQAGLAEAAGLTARAVEGLERGRGMPRLDTACALADAMGVDVGELRRPPCAVGRRAPGRPPRKPAEDSRK